MTNLLAAVKRAAQKRAQADHHYRDAIEAARAEHTLAEIGDAAGLTRSGVHYLLHPDPRKQENKP